MFHSVCATSYCFNFDKSPYVGESRTVLDSGFHTVDSGFQVLEFISRTWVLDSNRQWDFGFLELYSEFQGPGFRIPQAKIFRIPLHGSR